MIEWNQMQVVSVSIPEIHEKKCALVGPDDDVFGARVLPRTARAAAIADD
jgi:hypothetical protein